MISILLLSYLFYLIIFIIRNKSSCQQKYQGLVGFQEPGKLLVLGSFSDFFDKFQENVTFFHSSHWIYVIKLLGNETIDQ